MKYIFLDLDGVMIPEKPWLSSVLLEDGFPDFSNQSVNALNSIITDDTIIILISSHRNTFNEWQWKNIFSKRNIKRCNIITIKTNYTNKLDLIKEYFEINTIEDFIIIDDDKQLFNLPIHLKNKLITPSSMVGLKIEDLQCIK